MGIREGGRELISGSLPCGPVKVTSPAMSMKPAQLPDTQDVEGALLYSLSDCRKAIIKSAVTKPRVERTNRNKHIK